MKGVEAMMHEQRFKKGDRVKCTFRATPEYGTIESYEPDHSGVMYYRVKWDPVAGGRQLADYGWNESLHPAAPPPTLEQAAIANAQALVNTVRAKREADEALGAFNKARQRFDREIEDLKRKHDLEIEGLRALYVLKNKGYAAASAESVKTSKALEDLAEAQAKESA